MFRVPWTDRIKNIEVLVRMKRKRQRSFDDCKNEKTPIYWPDYEERKNISSTLEVDGREW